MTHQVLTHKWRPHDFASVIGQQHVVQTLTNALTQRYLHHAYLFTGTRGVGKTTIARILAKCFNCETGVTAAPCGKCGACEEIDNGRFPDFFEVDAASRTRVEDTRELLDNIQYSPTKGRYKIYLIDEVHMLSGHSFNALLKTLEEPPPHVIFLLATTDPQKLPATVLSRCLQFHLSLMPDEQIDAHLQTVLTAENIPFDRAATALIAKAANGSMRDGLSLLDQSIAYGNGKVMTDDIKAMLGTIEPTLIFDILRAIAAKDADQVVTLTEQLQTQGANFANALSELLSVLHQISRTQLATKTPHSDTEINQLAKDISTEDIQLFYQIGLIGQRDLALAPNAANGFEMTLLRMIAFVPVQEPNQPSTTTQNQPVSTPQSTQPTAKSVPKSAAPAAQSSNFVIEKSTSWYDLFKNLHLTGPTQALAAQCVLKDLTDTNICLSLHPKHKPLLNSRQIGRIEAAIRHHCNKDLKVTIDVEDIDSETAKQNPAAIKQQNQQQKLQQTEQQLLKDENVKKIMQTFDATLVKDSITLKKD